MEIFLFKNDRIEYCGLQNLFSSLCTNTNNYYVASLYDKLHEALASSPGLREGEEREGLVSTACACAVIMQILNNPITYGYCLVYLPFDLNSSRSTYLEMTVWTVRVLNEILR